MDKLSITLYNCFKDFVDSVGIRLWIECYTFCMSIEQNIGRRINNVIAIEKPDALFNVWYFLIDANPYGTGMTPDTVAAVISDSGFADATRSLAKELTDHAASGIRIQKDAEIPDLQNRIAQMRLAIDAMYELSAMKFREQVQANATTNPAKSLWKTIWRGLAKTVDQRAICSPEVCERAQKAIDDLESAVNLYQNRYFEKAA